MRLAIAKKRKDNYKNIFFINHHFKIVSKVQSIAIKFFKQITGKLILLQNDFVWLFFVNSKHFSVS